MARGHAPSKRGTFFALLVVIVLLVGCSVGDATLQGVRMSGPVDFVGDERIEQAAGVYAKPGQTVVFGATVVKNAGESAVELTEGTLDGDVPAGARLLEVRVIDLASGPGDLVGAAVWPFEDYAERSVPLDGFSLAGGAEAELLYIVQVLDRGAWRWSGAGVRYLSDSGEFRAETNFGFEICAALPDECAEVMESA